MTDPALAPASRGRARGTRTPRQSTRTRTRGAELETAEGATEPETTTEAPEAVAEAPAEAAATTTDAEPVARAPRTRGRARRGIPADLPSEEAPAAETEPAADAVVAEDASDVTAEVPEDAFEAATLEEDLETGRPEPRGRGRRGRGTRGGAGTGGDAPRERGGRQQSQELDLEAQIDLALQQQRGIPPRERSARPAPEQPVAARDGGRDRDRFGRRDSVRDAGRNVREVNRDPMRDRRQIPEQPRSGSLPRGSVESQIARQNVLFEEFTQQQTQTLREIQRLMNNMARGGSGAGAASGGALMALPKVGIFLDVPNLIYAAEQVGARIHFGKLLDFLTEGRQLVRATAYAPITDDPSTRFESQRFVQPVLNNGYKIVTKPWKRFADGGMKANFDIELAVDILTMSDRLDIVVLLSGDGDFRRVCELVESKGVRVEVVSFAASTAMELRSVADSYIDVGSILHMLTP